VGHARAEDSVRGGTADSSTPLRSTRDDNSRGRNENRGPSTRPPRRTRSG
jgi:hypothetical protein